MAFVFRFTKIEYNAETVLGTSLEKLIMKHPIFREHSNFCYQLRERNNWIFSKLLYQEKKILSFILTDLWSSLGLLQFTESEVDDYEPDGKINHGFYSEEMYPGEDGQLSWFNAGVRVGVGIGLGMCLGIGIGVGLLMRSYQATTSNFRRRFLWSGSFQMEICYSGFNKREEAFWDFKRNLQGFQDCGWGRKRH